MSKLINESWRSKAAQKRASLRAAIPLEWRLDQASLDRAAKERDLTGPYIEQYLTVEEIEITNQDSISIVENIRCKKWSAVQVTRAFCKVAAIAQQLVEGCAAYVSSV